MPGQIPCPFVYSTGMPCSGHIDRIETYKADAGWILQDDGTWSFYLFPQTHYHLFCSEKGNHAGYLRPDSDQLKYWPNELAGELAEVVEGPGASIDIGKTLQDACDVLSESAPPYQFRVKRKGTLDSLLPEGTNRSNLTSDHLDDLLVKLQQLAEWYFRQGKAWNRIRHIVHTQGTAAIQERQTLYDDK